MTELAAAASPLLECVPNVSEGRNAAALAALERRLALVPGLRLLDLAPDPDHHRSVVTLAGDAAVLREGVLALFDWAAGHVDLRHHRGVHPRVGAVDVVPFVPLAGATMADAVAAAEATAAAVAAQFDLPVYLYEEAARVPGRRLLADIRRGQFEGFAAKIAQPDWAPDFGPTRVHASLGVTVVGARFFLLAVNARLATADVTTARAIARAVREATGGLPGVRALGLLLESRGCAQVSMNLVDFRRTSLPDLLARVEAEARARGTEVIASELVGLAPAAALLEPLRAMLRSDALGTRQIVEWRLLELESGRTRSEDGRGQAPPLHPQ
jgi:glutamate formiminotransferase / 5-formyltetrahydrofolate cyclo-ligase